MPDFVEFHALLLKLPIQTSLSVAPELQVSLRSDEHCPNFSKTSTPRTTKKKVGLMDDVLNLWLY